MNKLVVELDSCKYFIILKVNMIRAIVWERLIAYKLDRIIGFSILINKYEITDAIFDSSNITLKSLKRRKKKLN